jgi:hypothetical protein
MVEVGDDAAVELIGRAKRLNLKPFDQLARRKLVLMLASSEEEVYARGSCGLGEAQMRHWTRQ